MSEKQKKEPKEPLRIPLDFEETLADFLKIKPPPDKKTDSGTTKPVEKPKSVSRKG